MTTPRPTVFVVVLSLSTGACAVIDPPNLINHTHSATARIAQLASEVEETDTLRRMGRSSDLFSPLAEYRMPNPPLMRTRIPDSVEVGVRTYMQVLNDGENALAGYRNVVRPIPALEADLDRIPEAARAMVKQRLGIIDGLDAVTNHAAAFNGRVRGARQLMRGLINLLEDAATVSRGTTGVASNLSTQTLVMAQQNGVLGNLQSEISNLHAMETISSREATVGGHLFQLGAIDGAADAIRNPAVLPTDPTQWELP
jgi:hypothetical protein